MTAVVTDVHAPGAASARIWQAPAFAWLWPLGAFLLTRGAAFLFISAASASQIALGVDTLPGYFVFHELPADPGYLGVITNWDGQWYQAIATDGYRIPTGDESAGQHFDTVWAWAFPPGFPMVVRCVMVLTGLSFAWSATLVNLVAGSLAMLVWFRVLDRAGGRALATAGTLLACCFVTAPLYQAAYSESLAMLLLGLCFLSIQKRQYLWAIVPVTALAMTRLITPVIAVVVVVQVAQRYRRGGGLRALWDRRTGEAALLAAIAVGGAFLWSTVASAILGDAGGYQRTALLAGEYRFGWFASAYESAGFVGLTLVVLVVVLLLLVAMSPWSAGWGLELRTWAVAYPLFLLTVTPLHTGILRYLLLAPTLGLVVVGSPGARGLSRARWGLVVVVAAVGLVCQHLWVGASLTVSSPTPLMP